MTPRYFSSVRIFMLKELSHIFCPSAFDHTFGCHQQLTQNYTSPDDNQKYGRKLLDRTYGTIPLPSRSRY